jgi:uncharacterized protein YggE
VADERTLVVVGMGSAGGTPDQCVLNLALNGMGTTPAEALGICSGAAEAAIAAAVAEGVARDDVRTIGLSVQDYFDQVERKVTAHIGSYQLEVLVRNLDDVGRVLGVLSDAAGDALQIRSLQLGIENVEEIQKAARREAVLNARSKAQDLAESAGLQLGEILSLEDNEQSGSQGRRVMAASSSRGTASVPVEPGHVSVTVSVTIKYGISTG